MSWYLVTCRNGKEEMVKSLIEQKVKFMNLEDSIRSVFIPTERVLEAKGGKPYEKIRKPFPGYVLVDMDTNIKSYESIRGTSGVTGFVGDGRTPKPLSKEEVTKFMGRMLESPRYVLELKKGDKVQIRSGSMRDMAGTVDRVSGGRVYIKVDLLGKVATVEVDITDLEKI